MRDEGSTYRDRLLACFPDDAWRRPVDVIRSLRGSGQSLHAAQIQFRAHARPLVEEGVLEARGKTTSRRYRKLPSMGEAVALVRDLAARHPPPSAPAPAVPRPSSVSGEAAEGPGALEDRLGRAVAAACRAFLAEWERP